MVCGRRWERRGGLSDGAVNVLYQKREGEGKAES